MVCTIGESTPTWRGARITCTPSVALKLLSRSAKTKSSPPRAPTSCIFGFYFVQQAVVRGNHDNGHVLVHQCQRAVFQLTRRIRFGVDIGNLFQLQCAFKGDWEVDAATQEERAGFLGKFLRPSGDLRLKVENVLNAAGQLA